MTRILFRRATLLKRRTDTATVTGYWTTIERVRLNAPFFCNDSWHIKAIGILPWGTHVFVTSLAYLWGDKHSESRSLEMLPARGQ